jgi:CheY-like chemotaxis protein
MPSPTALEATKQIRALPQERQPYIIAMTAHAMKGDRKECLGAGMNDHVSKPVRIEELHDALERCCRYKIGFGLESSGLLPAAEGK